LLPGPINDEGEYLIFNKNCENWWLIYVEVPILRNTEEHEFDIVEKVEMVRERDFAHSHW
jgi:hypothetical protein